MRRGGARPGAKATTDLVMAEPLGGQPVGELARKQAERGVQLVRGQQAQHVGGDALAQPDLDARVRLG